jgi:adenylate cyclase class 2
VGGGSGTGVSETVSAGSGDRKGGSLKERSGDGVRGNADADERAGGCDGIWDRCGAWEKQSKWAGPEGGSEIGDARCKMLRDCGDCRELVVGRDVNDEWVPGWALLGGEDSGDGGGIKSVGAEAVDSFGWESDQAAFAEQTGGFGDVCGIDVEMEGGGRHCSVGLMAANCTGRRARAADYTAQMQAAEIELKFMVSDEGRLREAAGQLGFRLATERTFEENTLYDSPDRGLQAKKQILRLRRYGGRCTVTHKRQGDGASNPRYKTRIETESVVEDCDALQEIFRQLGLIPVFRYEKYRTEWEMGEGHLVLDETPIGIWAELEGPPAWIEGMLEDLGVRPEMCSTQSYGRLFEEWKKRTGSPAENLTFEEAGMATAR